MSHIKYTFTYLISLIFMSLCISLICMSLFINTTWAQSCELQETSFAWTQPPNVDILANDSIRWPIDASLRFAYAGTWCPTPDEISLSDDMGNEVPAVIYFTVPDQLIENGVFPLTLANINPLMSLEPRTDYTLTLTPPNPSLTIYEEYQVIFRTALNEMEGFEDFRGITEANISGNFCGGAGFIDTNAEDFNCVVPAHLQLNISFRPIPNPAVTYAIYRTSSTPLDEEGQVIVDEVDEVKRLIAFVPGVRADQAARSINTQVNVLYAPLARTDCFKVIALDEWGRERGGGEVTECVELINPKDCPMETNLPLPSPFVSNQPISGLECESIGIHGASGRTPIPQLSEERPEEEEEEEDGGEEEEAEEEGGAGEGEGGGDEGCAQVNPPHTPQHTSMIWILLLSLICIRARRYHLE